MKGHRKERDVKTFNNHFLCLELTEMSASELDTPFIRTAWLRVLHLYRRVLKYLYGDDTYH